MNLLMLFIIYIIGIPISAILIYIYHILEYKRLDFKYYSFDDWYAIETCRGRYVVFMSFIWIFIMPIMIPISLIIWMTRLVKKIIKWIFKIK